MPAAAGVAGTTTSAAEQRPTGGRYLYSGDRKLYLRGVTYGPFAPNGADGEAYEPEQAERDFAAMAEHGVNSVRVYTVPPRWLLDAAHRHGLSVLVGPPWEQHVTFLDDRRQSRSTTPGARRARVPVIRQSWATRSATRSRRRSCWHGRGRVTRQLERLYHAAKDEDPDGLVTYVNFPTTEYLQLPFVDFVCFNVYLEERARLSAYLARLQNLAGDLPVVMAEIGLDSRRNGEERQAEVLDWQVRTAFAAGCAGAFVFAWTDEWHRGGYEIEDWAFGLTTRERQPKPALATVADAFAEVPGAPVAGGPSVSVVACSYNGAATLRDCLEGLAEQTYRDYEVIVVNDGSTDDTSRIAGEYDVRLIESENRGLSRARNTGLAAASGDIVAYIDADARPDDEWLSFLAARFAAGHDGAVGGPNSPWPGAGQVARAVANAPGGPTHVLISDDEAEHIPGCNMAFRRDVLDAIEGSTRSSGPRATTSTCAGGCTTPACGSASSPRRWSGTTAATPFAAIWRSSEGTARRRACSSASGPRTTARPAIRCGGVGSTGTARPSTTASAAGASTTAPGDRTSSSRSTSRPVGCCRRCRSCPSTTC